MVELGLVEQRYQAVLEVLGGATVTEVAERFGVTRRSVHRWLRVPPHPWHNRCPRPLRRDAVTCLGIAVVLSRNVSVSNAVATCG